MLEVVSFEPSVGSGAVAVASDEFDGDEVESLDEEVTFIFDASVVELELTSVEANVVV